MSLQTAIPSNSVLRKWTIESTPRFLGEISAFKTLSDVK
jgi:hypothetical protein